jgi:hypothetical protein
MPLRRGLHMKNRKEFSQKLYLYIKYIVYIQYSVTYIIRCANNDDIYTLFLISMTTRSFNYTIFELMALAHLILL